MLRVCGRCVLSAVIIGACRRAPELGPPERAAIAVLLLLLQRDAAYPTRPMPSGRRDSINEHLQNHRRHPVDANSRLKADEQDSRDRSAPASCRMAAAAC